MTALGQIVIVGAGPTGLGAAYRLHELGVTNYSVLEAQDRPGGLASSFKDPQGFTWDIGGHVHFSHYPYYDAVVDRVLGRRRVYHDREAWVWFKRRFVPYPFQYNLHRLDRVDRERALAGLEHCAAQGSRTPRNFGEWIYDTFGEGIADLFMVPYNVKVWGYPLDTLAFHWISERVATPDLARVRQSIENQRDDRTWGPNNRFFYPLEGGTGAIWQGIVTGLDKSKLQWNALVTAIDLDARRVHLADERSIRYDSLISTVPLDRLCTMCVGLDPKVVEASRSLVYSSCHIVGVGLTGKVPNALVKKSWIYFPEAHNPYYRITILSNYSRHNVPDGGAYWSLMAEICESQHRPVDETTVTAAVVDAMQRDDLIPRSTDIVSTWHRRVEYGYPTPFLGRDEALSTIQPALESQGVYSRGRFGAWRYEVSNQDHCFMQGVELVDRIMGQGQEMTLFG